MPSPYTLIGPDGVPYRSSTPGTLGGHRRSKVYGRLDCAGALRWIAKGKYVQHRVFFADEASAIAAGFRPCGHCLRERYAEWKAQALTVRLEARQPFDWAHLLSFISARTVPGLETLGADGVFRRDGFALAIDPAGASLTAHGDIADKLRRARRMLDVAADPDEIEEVLGGDPLLPNATGMRNPGAYDEYEVTIRAIVGQQISVAGTRTILGRLHERGLFPDRQALAEADPATLPMPLARARALQAVARGEPLDAIKGVGPWTRDYVRMRMGDPDVLLATDLIVKRRLGDDAHATERWRPFRSYATHRLWHADTRR